MTAPVERRHRELAFRSRYPWVGEVPAHMASWLHGDDFFHHHDPEGLSLNSIAQALADIEAPLLAEIERLKTWIPCSERMPIVNLQCNLCLAWDGGSVAYAHFDGKQFSDWSDELCRVIAGVTHWMPLPEPPK